MIDVTVEQSEAQSQVTVTVDRRSVSVTPTNQTFAPADALDMTDDVEGRMLACGTEGNFKRQVMATLRKTKLQKGQMVIVRSTEVSDDEWWVAKIVKILVNPESEEHHTDTAAARFMLHWYGHSTKTDVFKPMYKWVSKGKKHDFYGCPTQSQIQQKQLKEVINQNDKTCLIYWGNWKLTEKGTIPVNIRKKALIAKEQLFLQEQRRADGSPHYQ